MENFPLQLKKSVTPAQYTRLDAISLRYFTEKNIFGIEKHHHKAMKKTRNSDLLFLT